MKFWDALRDAVEHGAKVYRPGWKRPTATIDTHGKPIEQEHDDAHVVQWLGFDGAGLMLAGPQAPVAERYSPTHDDLMADDWATL